MVCTNTGSDTPGKNSRAGRPAEFRNLWHTGRMAKNIKEFGTKVGTAASLAAFPGMAAGQALANYGAIGMGAVGAGIAGAAITGAAGVVGATIHQRGQAKGRKQHAQDAFDNARR